MEKQQVHDRVLGLWPGVELEVSGDECGHGAHLHIRIWGEQLKGLGRLERQRKVMALFEKELRSGDLHALRVEVFGHAR